MNKKEIVNRLSLEEKAGLLTGYGPMGTMPVERFEIPSRIMADGPHGVRLEENSGGNATHFPNLCALSSSWDKAAAYRMGAALGRECLHFKKDMLLGPGVNIKRHILCGRNFEYLSEDPVLSGELAASYIQGLQDQGVSACVKHLAVNNQETNRSEINVEADERTLREIYLKAFQIAVEKGKPDAVMCAYNKLNAVWCSENPFLLTKVLREEWEFEGVVVSDWGAVHHAVRAIRAGMDLIMPHRAGLYEEIRAGLEDKTLTREELDRAVEHVIGWGKGDCDRLHDGEGCAGGNYDCADGNYGCAGGNYDCTDRKYDCGNRRYGCDNSNYDCDNRHYGCDNRHYDCDNRHYDRKRQHEEAVCLARESMVLLKNERQALPLAPLKYGKIAVIGEYAIHPLIGGQGSAEVYPDSEYIESPLEQLRAALPATEIKYMELYRKAVMPPGMLWPRLGEFRKFVEDCDAILLFVGEMESESTESFDRRSAELNPNMEFFIQAACETHKKVIVVLQSGGALILGDWRERADAVVQMWLAGEGAGRAVCDILTGKVNPGGRLGETFPKRMRRDIDFGEDMRVSYGEGLDVGYRYYDRHPEEVAFPFGHGLSYTTFGYRDGNATLEGDELKVSAVITNLGDRAGAEVVQVYIGQCSPVMSRPVKELKAFEKVLLEAGQEKRLEIVIPVRELGYYNIMLHDWVVEDDWYRVFIGTSSRDIRLETKVRINGNAPYSIRRTGEASVGQGE